MIPKPPNEFLKPVSLCPPRELPLFTPSYSITLMGKASNSFPSLTKSNLTSVAGTDAHFLLLAALTTHFLNFAWAVKMETLR